MKRVPIAYLNPNPEKGMADNDNITTTTTAIDEEKTNIKSIAIEYLKDPNIKLKEWQIAAFLRKETRRKETQCDLYTHRIWKDNDLWSRTCASG